MGDFSVIATTSLVYLVIVFFLLIQVYSAIGTGMKAMRYSSRSTKTTSLTVLAVIGIWLGITGTIAYLQTISPMMLVLLIIPAYLGVLYVYKSRKINQIVQKLNKGWLVNIQFIRVFLELNLWFLYAGDVRQLIPRQITMEGFNFDIAIGLLAPFIAYRCFKARTWPKSYAIFWNVLGILTTVNIYVMIALTSETSIRVFYNDTLSNRVFNNFPFIWMATFTLPLFILFHLLSIKQIKTPVEKEDFIVRKRKREGKIFEN